MDKTATDNGSANGAVGQPSPIGMDLRPKAPQGKRMSKRLGAVVVVVLGALVALAVVTGNFLASAAMLGWAARISAGALTATALGGFIVRLAVITVVGIGVKQLDAVHFSTFCIVLVVAHLGLLFLELRHVSLTLAYPGLKPEKEKA